MKKRIISILLILTIFLGLFPVSVLAASHPFIDVAESDWFADSVEYVYTNQLMNGTSADRFSPEDTMTRAMLVTVLYRMDGSQAVSGTLPFGDTPEGTWYYDAVRWAYERRITTGVSETEFGPNAPITREMLVTFLYRYANEIGMDTQAKSNLFQFWDFFFISEYAQYPFKWAVQNGVINGISDTQLAPTGTATRAQCAAMLQRFRGINSGNSRYDESLAPPEVKAVVANDRIEIKCNNIYELNSIYGYQGMIAKDPGFSISPANRKIDLIKYSNQDYTGISASSTSGTYYYKIRSYKMDGGIFVYGPWTEVRVVTCADFKHRLNTQAQYSYELYFLDNCGLDAYTGCPRALYIKTDNPDPSTIRLAANGKVVQAITTLSGREFDDVEYLDIYDRNEQLQKVHGGYITQLAFDKNDTGTQTVELQEATSAGYTVAKAFQINVYDYVTTAINWIDSMIASQTNDSMNPQEKMSTVASYVRWDMGFRYLTMSNDEIVSLAAQPNGPFFITHRWDSATSPDVLTAIAQRIGGFEDIHNCYGDYPRNDPRWQTYHHQIYVVYNGTQYYYTVCPLSSTGNVGPVQYIDFNNTAQMQHLA